MNGYYDEIVAGYESMHFSPDANDFLTLFLDYLIDAISMDERNRLADEFVKDYPYSPFVPASQKFISYKFAIGDYGFGMYLGGGYHVASGPVTDWITQRGGASLGFSLYIKKFSLNFALISSFGTVLQDIHLKQNRLIWPAGERIEIDKFSIDLGMKVVEYKRLSLSPFVGVAFSSTSHSDQEIEDNPALKDVELGTSITPVVGFDLDFRLNKIKPVAIYYGGKPSIWAIGIKTAYYPNVITTQGEALRGKTFFVGLSLKMNFFSIKRVY